MSTIHVNGIIAVISSTLLKKQILLLVFFICIAVVDMPQKPNYKRNRDHSKHFDWSYELKRDIYNCYSRARENPAPGYMKRLESYWDEI